jgi:hypothetical protein
MGWLCFENGCRKDGEERVPGKPWRKKETQKTKAKMVGLCGGWPESIGNEEMEEKGRIS